MEEGESAAGSMKMKVLETPSPEKTWKEDFVNEGYDRTGSLTSPNPLDDHDTGKSDKLTKDEKLTSEIDKAKKSLELGDESFMVPPNKGSELKRTDGNTTNVDFPPLKTSDSLELVSIHKSPSGISSDDKPTGEDDKTVDDSSISEVRHSDSDSKKSSPRTDEKVEFQAPLASDESDGGLSGNDDWSTRATEPTKSTEC